MYNVHMNKIGQTAVVNIKIDTRLKAEAMKLAEDLGLTLSAVINALVKNFVRVKGLSLSLRNEEPTPYTIEMLQRSKEDIENNRISPGFDNAKDAVAWLNSPNKKYKNGSTVH